jgi:hypothetical protein
MEIKTQLNRTKKTEEKQMIHLLLWQQSRDIFLGGHLRDLSSMKHQNSRLTTRL